MTGKVWEASWPETWPSPPSPISFSALQEIEICPLRWALKRATYGGIWNHAGYPPAFIVSTATGQVLHRSLERILERVRPSAGPEAVVEVLRSFGGISANLEKTISELAAELTANPRMSHRASAISAQLLSQLPALRERTQRLLASVMARLHTHMPTNANPSDNRQGSGSFPRSSRVSPELELRDSGERWLGFADLVRVGDGDCEITDFKTGEPRETHTAQVRFYALLWFLDRNANPHRILANRLALVYGSGTQSVPAPSVAELKELEVEMLQRTATATAIVASPPPPARPSSDACLNCDVRQCCPAYWKQDVQRSLMSDLSTTEWIDAELSLSQQQGSSSWRATVTVCRSLAPGALTLLRFDQRQRLFADLLKTAFNMRKKVRVIGVRLFDPSEESAGLPALVLTNASEIFLTV
jgi:hypothetical protein